MDNEWNNSNDQSYVQRVNNSQNQRTLKPFDLLYRKSGKCFMHHFVPTFEPLCRDMIEKIRQEPPQIINYDGRAFDGFLALEYFLCYIVDQNPQFNSHLPKFVGDLVSISFPKNLTDSLTTLGWRNEGLLIYTSQGLKPLNYKDFDYGSQYPDMYFPKYPLDYFSDAFYYGTTTYMGKQIIKQLKQNVTQAKDVNLADIPVKFDQKNQMLLHIYPEILRGLGIEITWCKTENTVLICTCWKRSNFEIIHPEHSQIQPISTKDGIRIFCYQL